MNDPSHKFHPAGLEPDLAPSEKPTNVRWLIFSLGCGTSWFLYLHRYTFGLIKPSLAQEWGLDKVELGTLDFAFSISYSLAQVPSGLLGDFLGAHLFLGAIIVAWAVSLGLHAWAPNVRVLFATRIMFGLTQAGCYPTISQVSRTWFPRSIRTTLQGWIASFFGRSGGASANILFATVLIGLLAFEWRTAINILAIAGVMFGLLFAWQYRNSAREHPRANEAESLLIEAEEPSLADTVASSRKISFREMFAGMSGRSVLNFGFLLIQQVTSTFADAIYIAWIPFFLREEHGLEFTEMGFYSALPLIGGALGGAFGGFLNDRLIRLTGQRRWARSGVGLCGKGMACGLIFFALTIYEHPYAFCWTLFFVKFFSDWSQPTVWGTVTDIGGKATATVFGFNNMVGGFGGNFSPIVFGYVAQYYSWNIVFTMVGSAYLLSSLSWLFVNCTIPLMRELPADFEPESESPATS